MTNYSFAAADNAIVGRAPYQLPPLILHPFADTSGPVKVLESSRASLMLQGLIPNAEFSIRELEDILLAGRFCEIRMLFYVGRDVVRWIEQCCDFASRHRDLKAGGLEWQSFAALLIEDTPRAVAEKLKVWGVADHRKIFTRAIGLNAIFTDAPDKSSLNPDFIRNYHSYADQMFLCKQSACTFPRIDPADFELDLFASGEYSRMLERQWQS